MFSDSSFVFSSNNNYQKLTAIYLYKYQLLLTVFERRFVKSCLYIKSFDSIFVNKIVLKKPGNCIGLSTSLRKVINHQIVANQTKDSTHGQDMCLQVCRKCVKCSWVARLLIFSSDCENFVFRLEHFGWKLLINSFFKVIWRAQA